MITVLGSLNLDLVASLERLPEEGETLLARSYAEHPGGKGANQAVAAARAGGRVGMIGHVGDDDAGSLLRERLAQDEIDVHLVRAVDAPTGRAWIEVDAKGRNRIVVVPGANALWSTGEAKASLHEAGLPAGSMLLLQREVPDDVLLEAAKAARESGMKVFLNAAPAGPIPHELWREVDVLVVNEHEAGVLLGINPETVAEEPLLASEQLRTLGSHEVIITLGAKGAVFDSQDARGFVDGFPAHVVDTTAAGDSFVGAFAAERSRGTELEAAVRFGCAAGALATEKAGAQPSIPRRPQIQALLDRG